MTRFSKFRNEYRWYGFKAALCGFFGHAKTIQKMRSHICSRCLLVLEYR